MEKTLDLFLPFLQKVSQNQSQDNIPKKLLSIDPGETTGWALFEKGKLTQHGHLDIKKDGLKIINETFVFRDFIDHMVIEDYKVYPKNLKDHSLSALVTPRLIGSFEYFAMLHFIPITYQMAGTAKGFVTDDKLKQWGYWIVGEKHSRDAIRHGCYWLLFGRR